MHCYGASRVTSQLSLCPHRKFLSRMNMRAFLKQTKQRRNTFNEVPTNSRIANVPRNTLSLAQVKAFGNQLLRALVILEEHGIIHADIKPDNILVIDIIWLSAVLTPFLLDFCRLQEP